MRTAAGAEAELAVVAASALPFQVAGEEAGSVQIEEEVVFDSVDLRFPLVGAVAVDAVALVGPAVWARLHPGGRRQELVERCRRCCPSRRTSCLAALQTSIVASWLNTALRNYRASLRAFLPYKRTKHESLGYTKIDRSYA